MFTGVTTHQTDLWTSGTVAGNGNQHGTVTTKIRTSKSTTFVFGLCKTYFGMIRNKKHLKQSKKLVPEITSFGILSVSHGGLKILSLDHGRGTWTEFVPQICIRSLFIAFGGKIHYRSCVFLVTPIIQLRRYKKTKHRLPTHIIA